MRLKAKGLQAVGSLVSEPDGELQNLQDQLAERLGQHGLVETSIVCRYAHKIVVRDRATGVFVRLLICRQSDETPPLVNIMPIVADGFDRVNIDESRTFRAVRPGSDLVPIVTHVGVSLQVAMANYRRYPR